MVEVFRTNVRNGEEARMLIALIESTFTNYKANFDLEDCDRILRVKTEQDRVQPWQLIRLLKTFGFDAEVLPDDIPEIVAGER